MSDSFHDDQDDFVTADDDQLEEDRAADGGSDTLLEKTIQTMEETKLCVLPTHCHSFQQTNGLLLSFKTTLCAGCHEKIQSQVMASLAGGDSSKQLVKCVACGVMAHRTCALSNTVQWDQKCPVNAAQMSDTKTLSTCTSTSPSTDITSNPSLTNENDGDDVDQNDSPDNSRLESSANGPVKLEEGNKPQTPTKSDDTSMDKPATHLNEPYQKASPQRQNWSNVRRSTMIPTIALPESTSFDDEKSTSLTPQKDSENGSSDQTSITEKAAINGHNGEVHVTPLHFANHPFASVSRALQENISAHFRRHQSRNNPSVPTISEDSETVETSLPPTPTMDKNTDAGNQVVNIPAPSSESYSTTRIDLNNFVQQQQNAIVKFANNTVDAVRAAVSDPNRPTIGAVAVAGGIAGGVAGLAIAGPAGAFAGSQLATAGSALGVILEGSVSIGVFVASIATGGFTARQVQEQMDERRVLTFGEDGTSRKVLLVRPQIQIDPIWEKMYTDAKNSAPNNHGFTFLPKVMDPAKHERYRRDSDIIKTKEEEIPTNDKVLLLVSRMLSDKTSVPGFVYRYLVAIFLDRCGQREYHVSHNPSIEGFSPRVRRDDAHAVIKYVTASLMEARPGFGASPSVTELTATAVEGLLFARLYDLVFEEIVEETKEQDEALQKKIQNFKRLCAEDEAYSDRLVVSDDAVKSLRMLPQAHTAVDKLFFCVQFLERISNFFLESGNEGGGGGTGGGGHLCADSLLKMVCQHLIVADLPQINAEVAFLEEFARDEQLLRGKDGYALVTCQASLHFLNMSQELETDIFAQDDDEENVPVDESSNVSCSEDVIAP